MMHEMAQFKPPRSNIASKVNHPFPRLILLCSFLGLAACVSQPPIQDGLLPDLNIPERNINTFVLLNNPDVLENTYRNGDDLTLQLINLSGMDIVFPDNFGVRVAARAQQNPLKCGFLILGEMQDLADDHPLCPFG